MLSGRGQRVVLVPVLQDDVHGSDVDPQLQAADSQQLTETDARRHHGRRVETLQGQPVDLLPGLLQPNTRTHTHTHVSDAVMRRRVSCSLASDSQQRHVAAAAQLLDDEGRVGEGRSAVTQVIQEVQVLHQSEPVDQVRAGEMWQL